MSYFDRSGLVRMERGVDTENGILFLAYYLKLKLLVGRHPIDLQAKDGINATMWMNWKKDETWYQANPPQRGDHFSRDNMWGLYFLYKQLCGHVDSLPVFKWNDRVWWHPNGWAVFLSMRNWFYRTIFFFLVLGMRKFSEWTRKEGETSGALLWWLLYGSEKDNMLEDFTYYVTFRNTRDNLDNPILIEARKLWGHHAQND